MGGERFNPRMFRHQRGILVAALWAVNAIACVATNRVGPERQRATWPAYLGTAGHDASAAERLSPDPQPEWRTPVGRAVRGSPAPAESVVVVGTAERTVVLLDRRTGAVIWRVGVGGTIHGGPLFDGTRIFVATEHSPDGRVYAIDLATGKRRWETDAGSVEAPLALEPDALYAGNEEGVVYRLQLADGHAQWKRGLSGAVRAAPVPTPDGIAVATTDDTLYLLDPATGGVIRRLGTPGAVLSAPARDGHRLFLATTAGRLLEVDTPDFTVRWNIAVGDGVYGAPALAHDTVYVLTRAGALWSVPAGAPDHAHSVDLGIDALAGPTPTADGILVGGVTGEVLLVDAGGTIKWRAQVDGPIETPPLVFDGQLLVAGGHGDLRAYR